MSKRSMAIDSLVGRIAETVGRGLVEVREEVGVGGCRGGGEGWVVDGDSDKLSLLSLLVL